MNITKPIVIIVLALVIQAPLEYFSKNLNSQALGTICKFLIPAIWISSIYFVTVWAMGFHSKFPPVPQMIEAAVLLAGACLLSIGNSDFWGRLGLKRRNEALSKRRY